MSDKDTAPKVSDFNLETINTEEYLTMLRTAIQLGTNIAVFGRRGSGKTEIAKTGIATCTLDGSKVNEIYMNLSVAERTDMGGYPDMFGTFRNRSDEEKREHFVNFILPKFFEPLIVGDTPAVVVFDEVDKADPSIWAPLLEILQFKSINGRKLKNLQCCILTGNLISEGSQRPSLPLLDRAEKYLLKPDVDKFLAWASSSNLIHPSIRALLRDKPYLLYGADDGNSDLYSSPSPRSWTNCSYVLNIGEKQKWDESLLYKKVSGFVGKQAGMEYEIYFKHYQKLLPLVDAIFEGKDVKARYEECDPSMQVYAALIVCARLAGILDKHNPATDKPIELEHVGKFIKHVSDENAYISIRTQLTLQRMLRWKLEKHEQWSHTIKDIVSQVSTK